MFRSLLPTRVLYNSLPLFRQPLIRSLASNASPPSGHSASTGRHGALLAAIRQIEAAHGKGSLMQLGQRAIHAVDVISTGSIALDTALGVGGLPRGRIVEIYGAESSGKTTLALQVVAEAQKLGLTCFFCDAEHAIDPAYARALGIDLDSLYLSQPDTGEQALEIVDTMVRSGGVDVVVVDSVAALVPKAELEGEMGDAHMALQARLMSQALRKLTASLSRSHCLIIFINQIRSKVGVVFGSPDITTGGNALKFYASVRLEIKKTGVVKGKGGDHDITGNLVRVKVAKNKLAPPFRTADFEMTYGAGVSRSGEIVDLGAASGVLGRSGAWYVFATPEVATTVTRALGKASRPPISAVPVTRAADIIMANLAKAKGKSTGKKGSKGGAEKESGDDLAMTTADASAAAASVAEATSSTTTPSSGGSLAPPEVVTAGTPFAQGRDKAKAWFEARPAAMEAVGLLIRAALKAAPPALGGGVTGVAPSSQRNGGGEPPLSPFAAVGIIDARLPGPVVDEEDALFGEEGKQ